MKRLIFPLLTALLTLPASVAAEDLRLVAVDGGVRDLSAGDSGLVMHGQDGATWLMRDASDTPSIIPPPPRPEALPEGALPDGIVATGAGDIRRAWLSEPTRRYRHGILGDDLEAGALTVETDGGRILTHRLPEDEVFEDLAPRLVDLAGDGDTAILVVVSQARRGSALGAYGVRDGRLVELMRTPAIGQTNRWLNPIGAADLTGDGAVEVAVVTTPHIGGVLQVYDNDFKRLARIEGVSNHSIGSRVMGLATLADVTGDGVAEVIVPSNDHKTLRAFSLRGGAVHELASVSLPSAAVTTMVPVVFPQAPGRKAVAVGLANGVLAVAWW